METCLSDSSSLRGLATTESIYNLPSTVARRDRVIVLVEKGVVKMRIVAEMPPSYVCMHVSLGLLHPTGTS